MIKCARNDAPDVLLLEDSQHREGFPRSRLAVGEDCTVLALKSLLHNSLGQCGKHGFLSCQAVEDIVEFEMHFLVGLVLLIRLLYDNLTF